MYSSLLKPAGEIATEHFFLGVFIGQPPAHPGSVPHLLLHLPYTRPSPILKEVGIANNTSTRCNTIPINNPIVPITHTHNTGGRSQLRGGAAGSDAQGEADGVGTVSTGSA